MFLNFKQVVNFSRLARVADTAAAGVGRRGETYGAFRVGDAAHDVPVANDVGSFE